MCACSVEPLCQFCKQVIHACREVVVPYCGKRLHLFCWRKLNVVAENTGGIL